MDVAFPLDDRVARQPGAGVRLFLPALLFMSIFGWKIGFYLDLVSLVSFGAFIASIVVTTPRLVRPFVDVTLLLLACISYAIVVIVVHEARDIFYLLRSVRATVNFLGMVGVARLYFHYHGVDAARVALRDVFIAIGVHGALIVAMFLFEGLREALYDVLNTRANVNDTTPFRLGLRIPGLTYGLATTSVLQVFGLVLLPWVWAQTPSRFGSRALVAVLAATTAISVLLTGRTGLALGVVLVPLSALLARRTRGGIGSMVRQFGRGLLLVLVAAILVTAFLQFGPEGLRTYTLAHTGEVWALFTPGQSSNTVNVVQEMWFLPEDRSTILFGNSGSGRSDLGIVHSDVGFVLVLHGLGIIGSALMLAVPAYVLVFAIVASRRRRPLAIAVLMVTGSNLVLHAKEMGLMTRNLWSVESFLFACLVLATSGATRTPSRSSSKDAA